MSISRMNLKLKEYINQWDSLVTSLPHDYLGNLSPAAIGWKTKDIEEFNRLFLELRDECDQIHLGWLNGRWLATLHLKDSELEWEIKIIKLMQRRPNSSDAIGLDHVDFITSDLELVEKNINKSGLKWTKETNNPHCNWISVWFDDTEAKIRNNSVIDVVIAELTDIKKAVK